MSDEERRDRIVRISIMVGSVLLSVIVTIVSAIHLTTANSGTQNTTISLDEINIGISLLLGCSTFMIIELVALVFSSITYKKQQMEDEKFMDNISAYSHYLHDINKFYYDIERDSHGDNDLFVTYAQKEIKRLHSVLNKAARQREFSIASDYIVNASGVFDAFTQSKNKTLKMTFPIMKSDRAIFTSQADIRFFEVLKAKVEANEVSEVRVIVILEEKELEKEEYVKQLFNFFSATPCYLCRVAIKKDFETVCDSNGISSQYIDFGIYGPKMLYIAEQYTPVHKGTYFKEENRIKQYHRLFDEVWESDAITYQNPSSSQVRVDLASLISK